MFLPMIKCNRSCQVKSRTFHCIKYKVGRTFQCYSVFIDMFQAVILKSCYYELKRYVGPTTALCLRNTRYISAQHEPVRFLLPHNYELAKYYGYSKYDENSWKTSLPLFVCATTSCVFPLQLIPFAPDPKEITSVSAKNRLSIRTEFVILYLSQNLV